MRLFKLPGCKITLCVLAAGMLIQAHAGVTAAELSAVVKKRVHPVLIRNDHNALLSLTITADKPFVQLESVTVSLAGCDDVQDLDTLKLFQASGEGKFETTAGFGDRLAAATAARRTASPGESGTAPAGSPTHSCLGKPIALGRSSKPSGRSTDLRDCVSRCVGTKQKKPLSLPAPQIGRGTIRPGRKGSATRRPKDQMYRAGTTTRWPPPAGRKAHRRM